MRRQWSGSCSCVEQCSMRTWSGAWYGTGPWQQSGSCRSLGVPRLWVLDCRLMLLPYAACVPLLRALVVGRCVLCHPPPRGPGDHSQVHEQARKLHRPVREHDSLRLCCGCHGVGHIFDCAVVAMALGTSSTVLWLPWRWAHLRLCCGCHGVGHIFACAVVAMALGTSSPVLWLPWGWAHLRLCCGLPWGWAHLVTVLCAPQHYLCNHAWQCIASAVQLCFGHI
jgi:hypothetical protein